MLQAVAAPTSPALPVRGPATLALDGQQVEGVVLSADADLGFFVFVLEDEVDPLPVEGQAVRLRWEGRADFDAEAKVVEVQDPDRWVMSVPVALDPAQRRRTVRLLSEGAWTFRPEAGGSVDVYDITERGMGLDFRRGQGPRGRGDAVAGRLLLAGQAAWDVLLRCTNVRAHPSDRRLWIVGGRLEHASPLEKERLKVAVDARR